MDFNRFTTLFAAILYYMDVQILQFCSGQQNAINIQPAHIKVRVGESITVNCSTTHKVKQPFTLRWFSAEKCQFKRCLEGDQLQDQKRTSMDTQTLYINHAQPGDSGHYSCILTYSDKGREVKTVLIYVENDTDIIPEVKPTQKTFFRYTDLPVPVPELPGFPPVVSKGLPSLAGCNVMFQCDEHVRISCQYICDGVQHCPNAVDEYNCPVGVVKVHSEDDNTGTINDEPDDSDDQMTWLKTTVYTVIACTVGVVLFISIVVIAIFRIKMKRAAVRRAMRQAERRRRHAAGHNCDGHGHQSSRAQRNNIVEHEPYISAPSPTHFGNIIVNVNNGVQFVPSAEFTPLLPAPPTYTEVIAENRLCDVNRHSPPPEYSTIDRNPNRLSALTETDRTHHQRLERSNINNNITPPTPTAVVNDTATHDGANLQLTQTREVTPQQNCASNNQVASLPVGGTNSLGRRSSQNRHSRNVRSVGSPRRPKQLQVRDGRIVLDENSSNSSSPETINRNTQTNPADISVNNQNAGKPSLLQVQAGQIILANQETGNSASAEDL